MQSIEVDRVGKRYRIGERRYTTLRDSLSASARSRRKAGSELEHWALRDVSFSVDQGEVVGIVGRNGAGKSTLLKILARITEPTTGVSRTRGRLGALLDVGTGFHPELTGRENVFLNGAVLGMKRAEIKRRFDDIVEFAGIERFLDTPVKRYSSGMYLRLAFAIAAHVEPDVVVVDEVLAVGDAEFQRRSLGRMSEFAREGRTVLFVSHDLGAVARVCRRGIWLDRGVVEFDGPVQRALDVYLGSRGERASYVEFETDSEDAVQLAAVGITDPGGGALDAPQRDEAFAMQVRIRVSEPARGLDLRTYLVSAQGTRVIDESLLDATPAPVLGDRPGMWEATVVIPPVLAAGDYVLGVAASSPYEAYFDEEALRFTLWPRPDERQASIDRSRLVQPPVEWRVAQMGS